MGIYTHTSFSRLCPGSKHTHELEEWQSATCTLRRLSHCLTGALFGYSVGFMGGTLVLPSFLRHFRLDGLSSSQLAAAQANIVSAWLVGAFLGVPMGMPICSRWGRKPCVRISAISCLLGTVVQLIHINAGIAVFNIGRMLNGLGVGIGTLASPM